VRQEESTGREGEGKPLEPQVSGKWLTASVIDDIPFLAFLAAQSSARS